jgi:ABC-type oligopeptide transport system substrate-binding subunit
MTRWAYKPSENEEMKRRSIIAIVAVSILALTFAACGRKTGTSNGEKVIKSTQSGNLTITLASSDGQLKSGENDLMLSFTDASGKTVDVGAASLKFHMPAMGMMAEMTDTASLSATNTPGKYRAKVDIEVDGTWEAIIVYQGPQGSGQVSMTVQAK